MNGRRSLLGAATALICSIALTACSNPFSNASSASPTNTESASSTPTNSPSQSPSVSSSPTATQVSVYPLYYFADTSQGLRLYREFHRVTEPLPTDLGLAALQRLVNSGEMPHDTDYSTAWATGSTVNSIKRAGNVAVVDISIGHLNVGAEGEQRAIDQLVWTLTATDKSVHSVKFTSGGKSIESFAGHVDATVAFKREPSYEVLATVWVNDPGTVSTPVIITGSACTFEAAVPWDLLKDGKVVKSDATLAAQACPVRSAWKVSLGTLDPGTYVFRAKDVSAADGSLVAQDTKTFVVK